jgi:hypothetical protein
VHHRRHLDARLIKPACMGALDRSALLRVAKIVPARHNPRYVTNDARQATTTWMDQADQLTAQRTGGQSQQQKQLSQQHQSNLHLTNTSPTRYVHEACVTATSFGICKCIFVVTLAHRPALRCRQEAGASRLHRFLCSNVRFRSGILCEYSVDIVDIISGRGPSPEAGQRCARS